MDMMNTVYELKKGYNDMMSVCKKKLGEEMFDDEYVDVDTIEIMRNMFRMCDLAITLVEQQTKTLNDINNKFDKLLADVTD
jgi:hypothetical protein